MRLSVNNHVMKVEIKDVCFTLGVGEDLIETREKFLEYMGQMFDGAIYDSLTENITEEEMGKCLTGGRGLSHIPNTVMMQMLADGKENYDTLKEISDYIQNNKIV